MKELKFRVWDPAIPKSITETEGNKASGDIVNWEYVKKSSYLMDALNGKYTIMLYTGLKLKNGKEIYEGDIIEAKLPTYATDPELEETLKEKIIIGEVRIRPAGGTGILVRKIIGDKRGIQIGAFLKIKTDADTIIGNIYENPELMEVGYQ